MNSRVEEYDLYLDETGLFDEGHRYASTQSRSEPGLKGLSQLVGILVPRNTVDSAATAITQEANRRANLSPQKVIHATDIIKRSYGAYLQVARAIINAVQVQRDWQCVRLVNVERISYFDRPTNYPNLVAELTLRTFQQKVRESPGKKIGIRLIDPKYKLDASYPPLTPQEYARRIPEYLGFAEVRYGLTRESRNWRFDGVVQKDYKDAAALQICDVLSHASADRFERIRSQKDLKSVLGQLFGDYDFTLTIRELFERVDELIRESSFGMALIVLAEALVDSLPTEKQDTEFVGKLRERLNQILERLGRMSLRGRDPQLALLVGWLDQLIGHQRLLDKGYQLAHWLIENVDRPLREKLLTHREENTLDWFTYSVHRWALTACNHKGVVLQGQSEVNVMKTLQPSVARQWERIPLVMDGLISQAVHATDCLDFDNASKLMEFVAESLKGQSNRFHEYLPTEFPEKLKFDLRARALGTLVQSESMAGANDPTRLQKARQASDEAIGEFTSFGDRARQYQYRCHLETIAGDFETARRFLVQSLEGTDQLPIDCSHNTIAELIRELAADPEWKVEFTLVHWLRIGAAACLGAHNPKTAEAGTGITATPIERNDFLAALDSSGQLESDACLGRIVDYPAHSILRCVAVVQAARGKSDEAMTALARLYELNPVEKDQFTLAMILLSAQAEIETLLASVSQEPITALRLKHQKIRSLPELVEQIAERVDSDLEVFSNELQEWVKATQPGASDAIISDGVLLQLAKRIAY